MWKQATQSASEVSVSDRQPKVTIINATETSAGLSMRPRTDAETIQTTGKERDNLLDSKGLGKDSSAGPIWNSLKPGPAFTGALTPSATTPGATTPGIFSFDEPFGEVSTMAVDPAALRARMDHVHDGGLEGGFHHGDDHDH
jgi:hypothetical protein